MHDDVIRSHIRGAATGRSDESERLIAAILDYCWPGGASDRSQPAALEWVREWGPTVLGEPLPACSCRQGRCTVCN